MASENSIFQKNIEFFCLIRDMEIFTLYFSTPWNFSLGGGGVDENKCDRIPSHPRSYVSALLCHNAHVIAN